MSGSENVKKSKPILCTVKSDKMQKSRVAVIERLVKHPVYKKYIRRSTKVMFHDEQNESRVGDKVLIEGSKPMSARKKFNLVKVVSRSKNIEGVSQ